MGFRVEEVHILNSGTWGYDASPDTLKANLLVVITFKPRGE